MELRSKKRLLNTRQLPGYTDGKIQIPQLEIQKIDENILKDTHYFDNYQNTHPFSKYHINKVLNSPGGKLGMSALNNLGDVVSTYATFAKAWEPTKDVQEYLQDAGTSNDFINGIAYTRQKGIDTGREMAEVEAQNKSNTLTATVSGAELGSKLGNTLGPVGGAVGGIVGGLGGFISGIFGGKKRKREAAQRMYEAQKLGININTDREATALTDYLQQDYAKEHGNHYATGVFGAREGKDAGIHIKPSKRGTFTAAAKARGMGVQEFASKVLANKDDYSTAMVKKANFARNASKWADGKDEGYYSNPYKSIFDVYTSEGLEKGQPNSKVAKGETILDNINNPQETTGSLVRRGKEGVDTELANLGENTIVLGGQLDWRTGVSFKDQAKPYTQALEHINKKFEGKGNKYGGVLANNTQRIQQQQIDKVKQPIVEKLKDLADQQQYQHQVEGYNEQYMVKGGKDPRVEARERERRRFMGNNHPAGLYGYAEDIAKAAELGIGLPMIAAGATPIVPELAAQFPEAMNESLLFRTGVGLSTIPLLTKAGNALQEATNSKKSQESGGKYLQRKVHVNKSLPGYDDGKPSIWDSVVPNSIGMLAALDQYRDASHQDVYRPNTYAANTYAGPALATLAGLDINGYELTNGLRDEARYANYGISQSGGLTGGQKMLMKLGNYENLRKHLAQTWQKIQEANNAYKSKYAEEALRYGAVDADNRMKAHQYDEEMFAKAHAAKLQGKQMGMRNFMDYLNHLSADNSQLKQFNAMWDLYNQDIENKSAEIKAQEKAAEAQREYWLTKKMESFTPTHVPLGSNYKFNTNLVPRLYNPYSLS